MSSKGKDKTGSKSRQRKPKAQQPDRSDDRAQAGMPDQAIQDQTHTAAPAEIVEAASAEPAFAKVVAREASAGTNMIVANEAATVNVYSNAPAQSDLIGIQTFANAYAGFVMRSFRETGYFVERLMGVRSYDKAVEVQTEFANQTCAHLAAESQNFLELYGRLAQQIVRSWQVFAWGNSGRRG